MMDSTTKTLRWICFYGFNLHFWFRWSLFSHLCIPADALLKKLHADKMWISFSLFWTLDSGLYFIYFRKNTSSLGGKLVTFFSTYPLTSFSALHAWACHWKWWGTSNIFSSLPQPFTALLYQRLLTSNSSWSCMGSNPALCREDQSESSCSPLCFDVEREGQSKTFCLSCPTVVEILLLICYFFLLMTA